MDYVIVPVGVMTCILLAVAVGFLWTKKHVSFMRIKSMRFVILQVPCMSFIFCGGLSSSLRTHYNR